MGAELLEGREEEGSPFGSNGLDVEHGLRCASGGAGAGPGSGLEDHCRGSQGLGGTVEKERTIAEAGVYPLLDPLNSDFGGCLHLLFIDILSAVNGEDSQSEQT